MGEITLMIFKFYIFASVDESKFLLVTLIKQLQLDKELLLE